jgi:hypothetical protein
LLVEEVAEVLAAGGEEGSIRDLLVGVGKRDPASRRSCGLE